MSQQLVIHQPQTVTHVSTVLKLLDVVGVLPLLNARKEQKRVQLMELVLANFGNLLAVQNVKKKETVEIAYRGLVTAPGARIFKNASIQEPTLMDAHEPQNAAAIVMSLVILAA